MFPCKSLPKHKSNLCHNKHQTTEKKLDYDELILNLCQNQNMNKMFKPVFNMAKTDLKELLPNSCENINQMLSYNKQQTTEKQLDQVGLILNLGQNPNMNKMFKPLRDMVKDYILTSSS